MNLGYTKHLGWAAGSLMVWCELLWKWPTPENLGLKHILGFHYQNSTVATNGLAAWLQWNTWMAYTMLTCVFMWDAHQAPLLMPYRNTTRDSMYSFCWHPCAQTYPMLLSAYCPPTRPLIYHLYYVIIGTVGTDLQVWVGTIQPPEFYSCSCRQCPCNVWQ
jgi:hypothetical protein